MKFHAASWSWKSLAARVLLVPVLAGSATVGTSASASAQTLPPRATAMASGNTNQVDVARQLISLANASIKKGDYETAEKLAKQVQDLRVSLPYNETGPGNHSRRSRQSQSRPKHTTSGFTRPNIAADTDPRTLVKMGRQAIAESKLDQAQDYATQANQAAAAKGYRWGLFEDTPASLVKDIQAARRTTDKGQAGELLKKAKTLFGQPTATDAERMKNLDEAMNMAYQSKNLRGDSAFWDFGDKPDTLISQIEAEKAKLRKKPVTPTSTRDAGSQTANTTPISTPLSTPLSTPATPSATPMMDATKAQVAKLVAEGRELLAKDMVVEAKKKADAARKLCDEAKMSMASFTTSEDSPDKLAQAAMAKGKQIIDSLVRDADKQIAAKANDKATAALDMAQELNAGLGLYAQEIQARKMKLVGGVQEAVASAGARVNNLMATIPASQLQVPPPAAANMPQGEILVAAPSGPTSSPMSSPTPVSGTPNMLDAAAKELARGDLDMARKMAIQAFNSADATVKANAQAMLRQIDVETMAKNKKDAQQAFTNAVSDFKNQQFETALGVLGSIDPDLLSDEQKTLAKSMMMTAMAKTKGTSPVQLASGTEPGKLQPSVEKNSVADEQKAMTELAFQKLRQEGLDAQKFASEAWGRGETDAAIKALDEYTAKVKSSNQSAARQANLLRPIETRIEGYLKLKHNIDVLKTEADQKNSFRKERIIANMAEAQKQDEIKKKVVDVNNLMKAKKFDEAEKLAAQLKLMDPDDPALTFIAEQVKYARRKEAWQNITDENERVALEGLNGATKLGPLIQDGETMRINPEVSRRAALRGMDPYSRNFTETERKIEQTLSGSVSLKFTNATLRDVVGEIRTKSGLNIVTDDSALDEEKISLDAINVTDEVKDLSLKDALTIMLEKARLAYVVENNVVKVTTQKRSKGRLVTKVFHVMDLVTPIPEYGLQPYQTLGTAMAEQRKLPNQLSGNNGPTPWVPNSGLKEGSLVSGGNSPASFTNGGKLMTANSLESNLAMSPQRDAYSKQLMKLVTGMVKPYSWSELGGAGNLSYYDIGGALVVNQTADVIREVQELLDSLRRLQDLSVSVEIRVVSLSEAFFERVGVDFAMNVKTNNTTLEREFATSTFRPQPFLNDINSKGVVGWSPADELYLGPLMYLSDRAASADVASVRWLSAELGANHERRSVAGSSRS